MKKKYKFILDEVINYGTKCFPVKNNSLLWGSCPKNLEIAFTVYILREKNKTKNVSFKKAKNTKLVILGTFKRSSFGLHWTAN